MSYLLSLQMKQEMRAMKCWKRWLIFNKKYIQNLDFIIGYKQYWFKLFYLFNKISKKYGTLCNVWNFTHLSLCKPLHEQLWGYSHVSITTLFVNSFTLDTQIVWKCRNLQLVFNIYINKYIYIYKIIKLYIYIYINK